eukprot:scaffold16752_cov85-Phaeocystis_antarctica.AAC.2
MAERPRLLVLEGVPYHRAIGDLLGIARARHAHVYHANSACAHRTQRKPEPHVLPHRGRARSASRARGLGSRAALFGTQRGRGGRRQAASCTAGRRVPALVAWRRALHACARPTRDRRRWGGARWRSSGRSRSACPSTSGQPPSRRGRAAQRVDPSVVLCLADEIGVRPSHHGAAQPEQRTRERAAVLGERPERLDEDHIALPRGLGQEARAGVEATHHEARHDARRHQRRLQPAAADLMTPLTGLGGDHAQHAQEGRALLQPSLLLLKQTSSNIVPLKFNDACAARNRAAVPVARPAGTRGTARGTAALPMG